MGPAWALIHSLGRWSRSTPPTNAAFLPLQIIPNFYPPLEAHVRQGVFNSLTHIVEKRVLA